MATSGLTGDHPVDSVAFLLAHEPVRPSLAAGDSSYMPMMRKSFPAAHADVPASEGLRITSDIRYGHHSRSECEINE